MDVKQVEKRYMPAVARRPADVGFGTDWAVEAALDNIGGEAVEADLVEGENFAKEQVHYCKDQDRLRKIHRVDG